MSKLTFTDRVWSEDGIGKPEPLIDYDGCWSRRVDEVNRIVYKISEGNIEILQCKGHYEDK